MNTSSIKQGFGGVGGSGFVLQAK